MKQIEVQIMGQSYRLSCPEGGQERLQEAVHKVDAAMCKIRDAGKLKARDRIAVLAALNLAFELTERPSVPQVAANDSAPASSDPQALPSGMAGLIGRLDNALARDGQLF